MSEKTISLLIEIGTGLAILVAGLVVIKIGLIIIRKALGKSSADEAVYSFVTNSVKIVAVIILALIVLGYYKVPTTPIVTVLGAAGAAIALALKDSLGNIAGGMLILINKNFGKSDFIEVSGVTGFVEKIDLFNTTLKTRDNKVVSIPNGTVTNSVLVNYSKENYRRIDCRFSVSYVTDLEKAKAVLLQVYRESPYSIKDNPDLEAVIGVVEQQASAIGIDFLTWSKTDDYWTAKYYLEEKVKGAFDEAGIEIPFDQLDVNIKENN